jgi:glycosyltransferase involved in cell wall biosynthesis
METLSILIMNWRDISNPTAGGAEVFTHEVAKRWVTLGHNVTVFTSRFDGAAAEEVLHGVRVVREGNWLSVYRRARRVYLDRFRAVTDIVIDEINTRPFLTPHYVDRRTGLFALIHQLAREYWSYETPFPISVIGRYWLENRWLCPYRWIPTLTVSQSTKDDLLALGFRNVTVVPQGTSLTPLSVPAEKETLPTLLYVGRLKKVKLASHALRAFAMIRDQLPEARLWVVGDGYLRRQLQRVAPTGVRFFGRVSEAKKIELMKRSHVLLYPAVREGWGLAVTEASAVGTPAIGYDVPGLRDSIRNGETGWLVPFCDIPQMAIRALSVLQDSTLAQRISRNCLASARGFSWDKTALAMLTQIR